MRALFAKRRSSLSPMQTKRQITRAILKTIARGDDRSPLFWWMVENHDAIAGASGARIKWKGLAEEAAARGLTDTRGMAVTDRNARETWRQARAAVASGKVKIETEPKKQTSRYPSRMPATWRPQQAVLQPSTDHVSTLPAVIPAPAPPPTGVEDETTMEARAKAETQRILAVLAARDAEKFRFGG